MNVLFSKGSLWSFVEEHYFAIAVVYFVGSFLLTLALVEEEVVSPKNFRPAFFALLINLGVSGIVLLVALFCFLVCW